MGMNRSRSLLLILTVFASLVSASAANAAFGDLDPAYGEKGRAVLKLGEPSIATSALAQPDGRVVMAGVVGAEAGKKFSSVIGTGFVARLTSTGKPDLSFGVNGVVRLGPAARARLTAASDGTIYALTTTGLQNSEVIYSLSKDGNVTGSFGSNGRLSLRDVVPGYNANAIVTQGESLLVIGVSNAPDQLQGPAVLTRLTPAGSVDASFGTSGTADLESLRRTGNRR